MNRFVFVAALFAYTVAGDMYPKEPENWNVVCDNRATDRDGNPTGVVFPQAATTVANSLAATSKQYDAANDVTQNARLTVDYDVGPQPKMCNIDSTSMSDLFTWQLAARFGLPDAGSDTEAQQVADPDFGHFGTDVSGNNTQCSTSGDSSGAVPQTAGRVSRLNGTPYDKAIEVTTDAGAGANGHGIATIAIDLDKMVEHCNDADRWSINGNANTSPRWFKEGDAAAANANGGGAPLFGNEWGCEVYYVPVSVMWEEDYTRSDTQDHPKLVVSVLIVTVTFCPTFDEVICITWVPEMELIYPVYAEVDSVMPIHQGGGSGKMYLVAYDFETRVENPGPDGDVVRPRGLALTQHCIGYEAVDRDGGGGAHDPAGVNLWQVPATLTHLTPNWEGAPAAPGATGATQSYSQNTRFGWRTAAKDFGGGAPHPEDYFAKCNHAGGVPDGNKQFDTTVDATTADLCFAFGLESCVYDPLAPAYNNCFDIDLPHVMKFCYKLPVTIFYAATDANISFAFDANEPTILVWKKQGHELNTYPDAYPGVGGPESVIANWRGAKADIGAADGVYNTNWLDAADGPNALDERGILQQRNQLTIATYFAPYAQALHPLPYHGGVHGVYADHDHWVDVDVDLWITPSGIDLTALCDDGVNHGTRTINEHGHWTGVAPYDTQDGISIGNHNNLFAVYSTLTSVDYGVPPEKDPSAEPATWHSIYPKRFCADITIGGSGKRENGQYVSETDPACIGDDKQIKLPMVTSYEQGHYNADGLRRDNVDGFSLNTYWTLEAIFTNRPALNDGSTHAKNPLCVGEVNALKVSGHVRVVHWGNYNNNNNNGPGSPATFPPRRALLAVHNSKFSMENTVEDAMSNMAPKQRRLLQQGNQVSAGSKGSQSETVIQVGQEEAAQPPAMIGPIVPIAAGGAVSLCCCFFLMAARRRSKKNKVKAFNKYKGEAFSAKVVDTAVVQIQAQNDVASVA